MSDAAADPKRKLSAEEVREAPGLDDWRHLASGIRARFRTGDFATGLALVDRIGAAAEEADHHPDITLTYPAVVVTLASHDVGGITSRDLDLARLVSGFAAEAGVGADTSGLVELEAALDSTAPQHLGDFYAALLGGEVGESRDWVEATDQVPSLWFQSPPGPDDERGAELPPTDPEQRWHLDVWVPHDEGERRLQAVLDAGGTLVSDAEAPSYWVVADADGNRSCICTRLGR